MFGPARRTWVLGGGGARGAAQVGVLQALFEANIEAPAAVVGTSVGALNGASIAAYPSLAGTMMLREVWMSRPALSVFQAHPLGLVVSGIRRDQLSAFPQRNVRRLIDRAKVVLMQMRGLDEEAAYAFMRKAAMDRKTKMVPA